MTTSWPVVRLGDVCDIVSGATPKTKDPSLWDGDICWVTPKDLSELEGKYIGDTPRKLTEKGLRSCSATVLPAGSVLLSSRAPIGLVAINTVPMATNQGFKSLVPEAGRADPGYLYRWLDGNRRYLQSLGRGATFTEISKAITDEIMLPLPPIEEQRRIATVLDQADELRAKRQASLALLDSLNESIFLDMFGDPLGNPNGWPVVRLAEVSLEIQIGPFGSLLHQSDYVEGGVPLVNPMHIVEDGIVPDSRHAVGPEKLAALGRYLLREGDIVMARRGEMGRCAVVDAASAGMVCGSGSLFIRPDHGQVDVRYLHEVLTSAGMKGYLERKALGVTMANLNGGIVGDLPVPLPAIDVQKRFASVTVLANSQRERLTSGAGFLDHLFSALQDRAFAGQL